MKSKLSFLLLALLVVAGCNPKDTEKSSEKPAGPAASGGTTAATGTTGSLPTSANTEPKKLPLSDLPADLKHDAFEYYGLGNEKAMDMEVTQSSKPGVITGTQTVTLSEVKDGKAVFTVDRTGGLTMLGTQKLTLQTDGVYLTDSTVAAIDKPQMELSSDITPGKTWTNEFSITQPQQMSLKSTYTVKGIQKFKTKKGEREGLLVVAKATGTIQGKAVTLESKEWYVKGVGGVKAELITTTGGKQEKIVIEEAK